MKKFIVVIMISSLLFSATPSSNLGIKYEDPKPATTKTEIHPMVTYTLMVLLAYWAYCLFNHSNITNAGKSEF